MAALGTIGRSRWGADDDVTTSRAPLSASPRRTRMRATAAPVVAGVMVTRVVCPSALRHVIDRLIRATIVDEERGGKR